ncbi:dihydrofolate reductase family protein [Nonomuraea sp. 3N208]|uniref:dihydrofolate reductase family protein n=1 Tax=Nonomuraea sp. 3N208 TaxID=3457421 RepID=UPI003FD247E1
MRKLIESTFVTLDGVISDPHVWGRPYSLKEASAWNGTLIEGDVATAVAELKRQPGENILKFGTGRLDRTLIDNKLVDEFHFWVFPTIAGGGERLLDGLDLTHLNLLGTTRFNSGIVVHTYGLK